VLLDCIKASPVLARIVPFALFLALTAAQNSLGGGARYWIYLLKTVLGAWMIYAVRPVIPEMRWKLSGGAVMVGVAVFVLWVGLDPLYPKAAVLWTKVGLGHSKGAAERVAAEWNPFAQFGAKSALSWFFVVVRLLGSSLVVPPLEEVFFRSFLYRYLVRPDFRSVSLATFAPLPFLITALVFGLEHEQWLAGILCAFAYQALVCWKGRLGDAITAHAITNLLLGLWVSGKGAWQFW
jgi:CAAX protease family protein